jgi:hypothetical protein
VRFAIGDIMLAPVRGVDKDGSKRFPFGVLWAIGGLLAADSYWAIVQDFVRNGTKHFVDPGNLLYLCLLVLFTVCALYRFRRSIRASGPLLVLVGLPAFCVWSVAPNSIRYPLLYGMMYHVDRSHVEIQKTPADCEWGYSPLGDKGCHYTKQVATVRNDAGRVMDVYVTWDKVQD